VACNNYLLRCASDRSTGSRDVKRQQLGLRASALSVSSHPEKVLYMRSEDCAFVDVPVSEQHPDLDPLLDESQIARIFSVDRRTVESWRQRGLGPPFLKISRKIVRYRPADVREFLDACAVSIASHNLPAPARRRKPPSAAEVRGLMKSKAKRQKQSDAQAST
jgi:hypothetical protein